MSNKKLIVNADDLGQSEGINNGIIQAHEDGIVTSASLMVRYPAAATAADYAKNNPRLGVGLHVDLGEWFYSEGEWKPLYEVVSTDDIGAVKEEITRQLESFYRLMGRAPTHLDSHQHVHKRGLIRPLFIELATKLNITLRGCGPLVDYCGDFYGQLSDGSPYHSAISVDGLLETISKLAVGITELACHPGQADDLNTMYKKEREIEVNTLCDQRIKDTINNAGMELCSFAGITFS